MRREVIGKKITKTTCSRFAIAVEVAFVTWLAREGCRKFGWIGNVDGGRKGSDTRRNSRGWLEDCEGKEVVDRSDWRQRVTQAKINGTKRSNARKVDYCLSLSTCSRMVSFYKIILHCHIANFFFYPKTVQS